MKFFIGLKFKFELGFEEGNIVSVGENSNIEELELIWNDDGSQVSKIERFR